MSRTHWAWFRCVGVVAIQWACRVSGGQRISVVCGRVVERVIRNVDHGGVPHECRG